MLSRNPAYKKLSNEARQRLDLFYRRFCQGRLAEHYGLGHMVYACHASFPLMLSPELANLIWINFKNYYFTRNNQPAQVHPMAVTDFLLSPLCTQVGFERYEVHPEIRSFLLMLLNDGSWFTSLGIRKEGRTRINELAHFLREYLQKKVPEGKFEGSAFRQLNDWAVMAWLQPGQLATEAAKAFETSAKSENEKAQLWLSMQLEKVNMQYEQAITRTANKEELNPFYRVFYYGRARNNELRKSHSEIVFDYAKEIFQYTDSVVSEKEVKVQLPLMKTVVERTDREVKQVQRVFALFVGVEDRREFHIPASKPSQVISEITSEIMLKQKLYNIEFTFGDLIDEDATSAAIRLQLQEIFSKANHEDIVLFYFSGNAQLTESNELICADDELVGGNGRDRFSEHDYNKIVHDSGKKCRSVIILDTTTGYYQWGTDEDIFIGATNQTAQRRGTEVSAFHKVMLQLLGTLQHSYSYRDMQLLLQHRMFDIPGEIPVMRIPGKMKDNYFLSKRTHSTLNYPLLAFNHTFDCWQVIDEDFTILQTQERCRVYDYITDTANPAKGGFIEYRPDQNIIRLDPEEFEFNKNEVYRVDINRPILQVEIIGSDESVIQQVEDYLKNKVEGFYFDIFSNWKFYQTSNPDSGSINKFEEKLQGKYEDGALLINYINKDEFCELTLYSRGNRRSHRDDVFDAAEFNPVSVYVKKIDDILPAIIKLVRYKYLLELQRPDLGNVEYDELNVQFKWGTSDIDDTRGLAINLTDDDIIIENGTVRPKPVTLSIINHENFTIFFDIYYLASDLTIKKVSGDKINAVLPGLYHHIAINEVDMLDRMLGGQVDITIKLLTSRDPILVDFSQKPITGS